jgi:DNA-binding response OmpR family regulator
MRLMPQASDIDNLNVLFIADDPDLAELYRLKLELDGYWVRLVTPSAALEEASARRPDIMFIDLSAGDPAGLRLLARLRQSVGRPSLPAIILSGRSTQELHDDGLLLSPFDYLVRVPASGPSLMAGSPVSLTA